MSRSNGDAPPATGPVGEAGTGRGTAPGRAPLHILVAEDNEINAQLLERLLARRGHRVRLATNGREALALAEHGRIRPAAPGCPHAGAGRLPGRSGDPRAGAVRRGPLARHRLDGAFAARRSRPVPGAGMDDFLAKPIQAADLWAATERVSGSRPPVDRPAPGLLDPRVLLAACGDDATTMEKLCQVLRARLPDHLMAVHDALNERDSIRLREATHKLRGTVAAFSTLVGAMASDVEEQAARGHLEDARPLVEQLEASGAGAHQAAGRRVD